MAWQGGRKRTSEAEAPSFLSPAASSSPAQEGNVVVGTDGLATLQEEHRRAMNQYRELLEGIDAEVKLQHHLRLEEELFRKDRDAILAQQADQDHSLNSLREVLAHWKRKKDEAQAKVEELCRRENKKRERLEARVKALDQCIEAERRQATEIEEAHKLVGVEVTGLDAVLRREVQVRTKFETKLGHSIDTLKKNAARAAAPAGARLASSPQPRRAAPAISTSGDGGGSSSSNAASQEGNKSEMDQSV
jgi:DNA repair exonuclease SbcCD ATPase subunit